MGHQHFHYPVPEALEDPRLRRFFDYWRSGFGDSLPPERKQFDPLHLLDLMGMFNIAKVYRERNALRFKFTLWGTQNSTLYGGDFTGRYLDEIMLPTEKGSVQDAFEAVARKSVPHFWQVRVPRPHREFASYKRLALPYRDGGTPEISHVIALIIPDEHLSRSNIPIPTMMER